MTHETEVSNDDGHALFRLYMYNVLQTKYKAYATCAFQLTL